MLYQPKRPEKKWYVKKTCDVWIAGLLYNKYFVKLGHIKNDNTIKIIYIMPICAENVRYALWVLNYNLYLYTMPMWCSYSEKI